MQFRAPRLNGTQAMSASALRSSGGSTKRSGSKRSGSSHAPCVAAGEVGRRQHERPLRDAVAADDDVDGGLAGRGHAGGVQAGRLPHDPVGEVEAAEGRLVDGGGPRDRSVDLVGLGPQPTPQARA